MLRSILAAGIFCLALVPVAYADDTNAMNVQCDEASMMTVQKKVDSMTDDSMKAQKDTAMAEMMAAKESMGAKKLDMCAMHIGNAMKAINMDKM